MPQLIGITGKARAGKDTAGMHLATLGYHRASFAAPLKRMIEVGFNLTPTVWEDTERKEAPLDLIGKSPRQLAQTLGTEWGRQLVHPQLWVLLAAREWQICQKSHTPMVVTDCRFDNEAEWIRSEGGIVVEIIRRNGETTQSAHASENGIDPSLIDAVVYNEGTIPELREEIDSLLNA